LNPTEHPATGMTEPGRPPHVPDHELIRPIGRGSSGEVWLASNALGTYRAIKIVHEKTFRHRRPFDREFTGVQKFEPVSRLHDGLIDILQVGRNDAAGYFYYVMELSDDVETGQVITPIKYSPRTLANDIAQHRRLPIGECVRLGAAIASALGFLHRHGLIHRDIKPSNIIFVKGFPKLADIGLVTELSEVGSHVGTEGFIPPEGAGTPQADIYSLGKVLYEISTGKDRHDYPELPTPLGDSAEDGDLIQFNKIVLNSCRADLGRRYQSAEELLTALLEFQFSTHNPHKQKARYRLSEIIGIGGMIFGFGVIIAMVWRLVWILKHTP
jgi:serine/threonine protein kinase